MIINMTYKLFLVAVLSVFGLVFFVSADFNAGSLIWDLYYNHGELYMPQDEEGGITVSTKPFTPPAPKSYPFYNVELYNTSGKLLISSTIDQKQELGLHNGGGELPPSNEEGLVKIVTPYDQAATRAVFKDEKGKIVLEEEIYNNFCNRNNVCEPQLNESSNTCAIDCQPSASLIPVDNIPQPSETPQPRSKLKIFLPLLIWFGLAIGLGVAYFAIKRRNAGNF